MVADISLHRLVMGRALAPVERPCQLRSSTPVIQAVMMPQHPYPHLGFSVSIQQAVSRRAILLAFTGMARSPMGTCSQLSVCLCLTNTFRTVRFFGVIPGGESFEIPISNITTDSLGTGFTWAPNIRGGTSMIVVAGDDRGIGKGGSASYIVNYSNDQSCISNDSPSSTPGTPAGGSYPTNTDGSLVGGGNANDTGFVIRLHRTRQNTLTDCALFLNIEVGVPMSVQSLEV